MVITFAISIEDKHSAAIMLSNLSNAKVDR